MNTSDANKHGPAPKASLPKRGLGRGLSALIPQAVAAGGHPDERAPALDGESALTDEAVLRHIPLRAIALNRHQPRKTFGKGELEELTESIRENGVLQPIVVRETEPGRYELVAGERRFRAASASGLSSIPAVVRTNVDDRASLSLALVENIQREDLNILEAAQAYQELLQTFAMTQSDLGRAVGKSQAQIANALRLLSLPPAIRESLRSAQISEGHAKVILSVAADDMVSLWSRIVDLGLTVRQAEREANLLRAGKRRRTAPPPSTRRDPDPALIEIGERIGSCIGSKVRLVAGKGERGVIEISYFDHEHLESLVDLLSR